VDGTTGGAAATVKISVTETKAANNSSNGFVAFTTAGHSPIAMLLNRIVASNNDAVGV
jgi:hypothetical protein